MIIFSHVPPRMALLLYIWQLKRTTLKWWNISWRMEPTKAQLLRWAIFFLTHKCSHLPFPLCSDQKIESMLRTFALSLQWAVFMYLIFCTEDKGERFWKWWKAKRWNPAWFIWQQNLVSPGFSPSVRAHFSYQLSGKFSEKLIRLWREDPRAVEITGGQGGNCQGNGVNGRSITS